MQPISPDWLPSVSVTVRVDRKRGFLLTAFLILTMVWHVALGSMLVVFAGMLAGKARVDEGIDPAADAAATAAHHVMLFLALVAAVNLVFLVGIWMWRKWGVQGYAIVTLLGTVIAMRLAPASAVPSMVWIGIVGAMIASKWKHFE